MRIGADGRRILTPEEQKQEFSKARECKFCENYELVRSLHNIWQKLNFCPVCGKQLANRKQMKGES